MVTAYWLPVDDSSKLTPIRKQLFEFERLFVPAGASREATFEVSALSFVVARADGDLVSTPMDLLLQFDDRRRFRTAEMWLASVKAPAEN